MKTKENSITRNPYKILSIVLAILLVLATVYLVNNYFSEREDKAYEEGMQNGAETAIRSMTMEVFSQVAQKGQVRFVAGNNSMVLVPVQMLELSEKQVIDQIVKRVQSEGYVSINYNNSQLTLVPYVPPSENPEAEEQ